MKNFGDDLFVDVLNSRPTLTGVDGDLTFLCPPIPGVPAKYSLLPRIFERYFNNDNRLGGAIRLVSALVGLVNAKSVILGGGSVLSSLSGVRAVQARAGRVLGTRWAATGVSIGPFDDGGDRHAVSAFLRQFESIRVRDAYSVHQGLQFGIDTQLGGDIALSKPPTSTPTANRLTLVPCAGVAQADEEAAVATIGRSLSRLDHAPQLVIAVLNCHPSKGDDQRALNAASALKEFNPTIVRYADCDLNEMWELLGSSRAVVSGRLHGAISAHANSVPFVAFEYHRKVTDFLDDVEHPCKYRTATTHTAIRNLILDQFSGA